jgi:hypothetical protein
VSFQAVVGARRRGIVKKIRWIDGKEQERELGRLSQLLRVRFTLDIRKSLKKMPLSSDNGQPIFFELAR